MLTEKKGVRCPFCGARVIQPIPVLYIYYFNGERKEFLGSENIIVGYPGRKIFAEQLKGDSVSKGSKTLFEIYRAERGYQIRNLSLPEMHIVCENSTAVQCILRPGESHELRDGMIFRLMTTGKLETLMINRIVNQS